MKAGLEKSGSYDFFKAQLLIRFPAKFVLFSAKFLPNLTKSYQVLPNFMKFTKFYQIFTKFTTFYNFLTKFVIYAVLSQCAISIPKKSGLTKNDFSNSG